MVFITCPRCGETRETEKKVYQDHVVWVCRQCDLVLDELWYDDDLP